MSTQRDEDDAWRSIVANFGERAQLDDEPVAEVPPEAPAVPEAVAAEPDEEPE